MTAPYFKNPPPNNPYGRTAKELAGYSNGRPGVPTGGVVTPVETVPILTTPGFGYELTAMPALIGTWAGFQRPWIDPMGYNVVRLIADVETPGATGSCLVLRVTSTPSNASSWISPGHLGAQVSVNIDAAGPQYGAGVQINQALLNLGIPLAWQVCSIGGDGVVSPVLGMACVQFELSPILTETWYWRDLAPGNLPTPVPTITPYINTGNNIPSVPPVLAFSTPTPTDVRDNARVLLLAKGSGSSGFTANYAGADTHSDFNGPLGRLVGAPLRAQHVKAFTYTIGYTGICPHGDGTGMMAAEMYIWRAATDTLELISNRSLLYEQGWFRYSTKYRMGFMQGAAFDALDGDRLVVDIGAIMEISDGALSEASGWLLSVGYDGPNDLPTTDFVDFPYAPASYVILPKLKYHNTDSTVAYP